MTIDEAISHALEVAEKHERHAKILKKRLLGSGLDTVDYCLQCAADHRQLAEWLTELKELRNSVGAVKLSNMKEALKLIRAYKAENIAQKKLIAEYKQLLKAAVEDFSFVSEKFINSMDSSCSMFNHIAGCVKDCPMSSADDYGRCKWRYTDEALELIES